MKASRQLVSENDEQDRVYEIAPEAEDFHVGHDRFKMAFAATIRSRYFWACIVYIVYTVPMYFWVDLSSISEAESNLIYIIFACIHLFNAFQYAWAWDEKKWYNIELVPEYLNILEASLYLWSAFLYPNIYISDDDNSGYTHSFNVSRRLELSASIIDVFASIGW